MYAAKSLAKGFFSYSINHSEQILKVVGEGSIELDKVIDAINSVLADSEFHEELPIIVDLSKIYYHPPYHELMDIKDHLFSVKDQMKGKIALVVNDDLYFIAVMICMFCSKFDLKIKSFKSQAKAKNWILETVS